MGMLPRNQRRTSTLGHDYDPYVESLDDTGQALQLADYAESRDYNPGAAAKLRIEAFETRYDSYASTHMCRATHRLGLTSR